ncbi:uncharacterized protein LOC131951795 [Physella acuta]|uniref:uncharacterized protein LOC131951795 n=1 Tax=Physella acuta TaxID=109671 RepID=UPI0027DDA13F|nr:uncharacterized protein LOC131951795 [Physella acuta]
MDRQSLCSDLLYCIGNAWTDELLYDVNVEIDGKSIKCHTFILAAFSEFFKDIFTSTNERRNAHVSLQNIPFDVFESILKCLYTGDIILTTDNYFDIWRAASFFKIKIVLKLCEKFAIDAINMDTWESIYKNATILESNNVLRQIRIFMTENFEQTSLTSTFLELSFSIVRGLITSHKLNVKNEDVVLDAVIRWVNHAPKATSELVETNGDGVNSEKGPNSVGQVATDTTQPQDCPQCSRKAKLPKLLRYVRTCLVSHALLTRVYKMDVISTNKDAREIIVKAILYHVKNFRQGHWPSAALHRACSGYTHGGVFAVDGGNFKFISAHDEKMYTITRSDLLQDCVQFTTVQGELYAIGKQLSSPNEELSIAVFRENKWNFVMKMEIKDCLFFSQRDLIHCYNQEDYILKSINSKSIEIVTRGIAIRNLPHVAHAMSLENYILFFYADDFEGIFTTCVIKFDLCSKSAEKITRLQGSAENLTSFRNDIFHYVLMKDGSLWLIDYCPYSCVFDFYFVKALWESDREVYGAFAYAGKLLIFGKHPNSGSPDDHVKKIHRHFQVVKYLSMEAKCSNIAPVILPTAVLSEVEDDS